MENKDTTRPPPDRDHGFLARLRFPSLEPATPVASLVETARAKCLTNTEFRLVYDEIIESKMDNFTAN